MCTAVPRILARRSVAVLVIAACVVAVAPEPAAAAARPIEERFAAMVDRVRIAGGESSMRLVDRLSDRARRHSRRMARANDLFHSYPSRLLSRSGAVAENVGMGADLGQLLRAFLGSPAHADNLLGPWSRTGIGIVHARGRYWVTQVFRS